MFRTACRRAAAGTVSRSRPGATAASLRHMATTAPKRSSALQTPSPPLSTTLPADAFQLLAEDIKPSAEDVLYSEQISQVENWWNSERYTGIKRPYSAEDVVSKRGALQQTYPSSLMARKLFNLFKDRAAEGKPVHTSTPASMFLQG
jgi:isocitrate lyase